MIFRASILLFLILLAGCGTAVTEDEIETDIQIYASYIDYWGCVFDGYCEFSGVSYKVGVFNTSEETVDLLKLKIWILRGSSSIGSFTLVYANILPRERRVQDGRVSLGGIFYDWEEFSYREEILLIE